MSKAIGGVKSVNGNEKGIVRMPNEMVLVKVCVLTSYTKISSLRNLCM